MKLSNTFINLSVGLVAAGPLAVRNPQNFGIPSGANGLLGRAGAHGPPQAPQQPSTELQPPNCGTAKVLLDGECVNQDQSPEPFIEGNKAPARSSEVVDPGFAKNAPVESEVVDPGFAKCAPVESEVVDPGFAKSAPMPEGPLNSEGFSKAGCDNMRGFLSATAFAKTKCDEFN